MGTEQQTFTGDASQLVAEYDKLEARARKLEEAQKKGAKTASDGNKQLAKEMKDLQREAEATTKSVMTPTEKYQAQLAKLNQQRAAGAISEETYARAVQKTQQELLGAGQAQRSVFSGGLENVAKMAAGWLSVAAAISTANAAHREKLRIERETADKQISIGAAENLLDQNLISGGVSANDADKFKQRLSDIQKRTGFRSMAQLNLAAAEGFSSSFGNQEATLSAIEAGAKLSQLNPDQLTPFVGGALDISQSSGSTDARRNMSFMMSVGGLSRIADPRLQSRNIAPAINSMVLNNPDRDRERATLEAGALFAALNFAASDKTGEQTKTASINLTNNLDKFFREGVMTGTGKNKSLVRPEDPATLAGRIEFMQNNPAMRELFFSKMPAGEANFQAPIRSLLEAQAKTFRNIQGEEVTLNAADKFRAAPNTISFNPALYDTLAGRPNASPNQRLGAADAASAANLEASQAENTLAGRRAEARDIALKTFEQTSPGYTGFVARKYSGVALEAALGADSENPERAAIGALQREFLRIEGGKNVPGGGNVDEEKALILRQIAVLDRLARATEETNQRDQNAGQAAAVAERKTHLEN